MKIINLVFIGVLISAILMIGSIWIKELLGLGIIIGVSSLGFGLAFKIKNETKEKE